MVLLVLMIVSASGSLEDRSWFLVGLVVVKLREVFGDERCDAAAVTQHMAQGPGLPPWI